jgi:hypothetical protein
VLRLIGLAAVLAVFWSAWWQFGSHWAEAGLRLWLAERRAEGWRAEAGAVTLAGYPLRFEMTVEGLALADPRSGLSWSAPAFRLDAFSWNPTALTAIWPDRQVIDTPDERIEITAAGMEASLALIPGAALTLSHGEAALAGLALSSSAGWQARFAGARLSASRSEAKENHYDLAFEASRVEPPAPALAIIDPKGRLPPTIDLLALDATLGFDAPWDRFAIERRRPQPTALDLRRLKASWGQLDLEASGALEVDAEGIPSGELQVRLENWREMVEIGVAAGLIPEDVAGNLESGFELLATDQDPETVELPLGFHLGFVTLGPVPLGPAPRLAIR